MNEFSLWFRTGLEHIIDIGALDHILFVLLLVLATPPGDWKTLLMLVTAFTVGHSISLALSVVQNFVLPASLIEFLIAFSIALTAIFQLLNIRTSNTKTLPLFIVVVFFGLFHGLGFSFLLRSMLGTAESRILPLLYFNLGIEAGQLIIVAAFWLFSLFLAGVLKIKFHTYQITILCLILVFASFITSQRFIAFVSD